MSGGSFNYLSFKDPGEMLSGGIHDLCKMEAYLRARGKADIADELLNYVLELETANRRLSVMHQRLSGIMYEVEWWASGDHDEESVNNAWNELTSITVAPIADKLTDDL